MHRASVVLLPEASTRMLPKACLMLCSASVFSMRHAYMIFMTTFYHFFRKILHALYEYISAKQNHWMNANLICNPQIQLYFRNINFWEKNDLRIACWFKQVYIKWRLIFYLFLFFGIFLHLINYIDQNACTSDNFRIEFVNCVTHNLC